MTLEQHKITNVTMSAYAIQKFLWICITFILKYLGQNKILSMFIFLMKYIEAIAQTFDK